MNASATFSIARREMSSFFCSPIAYVVVCLFLILSAIVFLIFTLRPGGPAEMRVLFAGLVWVLIPVLPAVGMRLIAEEHRSGTIESLMTCPISDTQVVLGKWLGALGFYVVILATTFIYVIALTIWGDPDWVRLYAEGARIYESEGYEFNEPLYFKMNGSAHEKVVTPLINPEYQCYRYEFQRYWHFYQVMGRIGYNAQTPSDTWEMEFKQRFGVKAGPELMQGLHLASKVLPRIVAASYLYNRFSSPQGWPELQRLGNLENFALKSEPSDTQQFASPMEEAELRQASAQPDQCLV